MGSIHNELNKGSLSKAIKNALGVDISESGVERFSETLQPIMNPWELPEWKLLRGEIPFARVLTSPAVAGRFSTIQLILAKAKTVNMVVETIEIIGADSVNYEIAVEQGDTPLGANLTTQQGVSEDTRYSLIGETSQAIMYTSDVAAGIALPQRQLLATTGVRFYSLPAAYVVNPGSKFLVFAKTVNSAFTCSLRWRERSFFSGERNP